MAFIAKNAQTPATRNSDGNPPVLEQWIRVSKAAATVPQSTTQNIFDVEGGRVLLKALIGEVTTAIGAGTTPDLQVEVAPDTGTAADLASDVVIASDEVGTLYSVEGDGTALIATSSGWGVACNGNGVVISPGVIRIATSESTAGATKWDLYYLPLDPAAYVKSA